MSELPIGFLFPPCNHSLHVASELLFIGATTQIERGGVWVRLSVSVAEGSLDS